MNKYLSAAVVSIVISAVVAIVGLHGVSSVPMLVATNGVTNEKAGIFGHVEYVVKNQQGKIVSYLQSDNMVVNKGKNCAMTLLFQSNSTTNGCTPVETLAGGNSATNGFTYVAIGNGTGAVAAGSTQLPNGGVNYKNATGQGSVTITQAAGGSGTALIQKTFTFTAGNKTTITSSGLFDKSSGATMNMFSGQDSLNTILNTGDSLTVKWTITVG
jgi:hypothetical protein